MGLFRIDLLVPILLLILTSSGSGQSTDSCSSFKFSEANKVYTACVTLPQLSSFLHWTYDASTGIADIAFRATGISTDSNWVAWALNPTTSSEYMTGAQALVAHKHSNGSVWAYTSSISGSGINTLTESPLSFTVTDLSTENTDSQIIIFAKVQLPDNKTTIRHLWQWGPLKSDGSPSAHDSSSGPHTSSKGTIDFLSGATQSGGGASRLRKKNIHGVLNAVSWGTLLPIGFLIARYLKVFADPAWFYLHILCQSSGYIVGVAGWALGLKLGSESAGITYHSHRYIGIAIFCFATLQVFALLLRPKKDHKYRFYWNIYHHGVGYLVIILSIINVFKGFDILDPEKKWKTIYIIILIVLASVAVFLEVFTWIVVLRRKRNGGPGPKSNAYGGGPNGYATRSQPSV